MLDMGNDHMPIDACKEQMKAIASCLLQLGTHNLRHLHIETFTKFDNRFLPDPWCPAPLKLRKLHIQDSPMPRIPSWMGSLIHLEHLSLVVKGLEHEDLCLLGCLPSLLHLSLSRHYRSGQEALYKDKLVICGYHGFPCLKRFYISGQNPMFSMGSMPKLELLSIELNASKIEILTNGGFDIGIGNLPCLTAIKCIIYYNGKCVHEEVEVAKAALERAVSTHPNHPSLELRLPVSFSSKIP